MAREKPIPPNGKIGGGGSVHSAAPLSIYAVTSVLSALFGLLCFPLAADVSLLAMPLSLAAAASSWFLARRGDKAAGALRKLLQYLPYILLSSFILRRSGAKGTSYSYDVVTVLLWCAVGVLSAAATHNLTESVKREDSPQRPRGVKWVVYQAVDWVDALLQAVFMVLLIQIFIVQLYVIPSESMVPQFLIKDRVVVFKTLSGPKFPLSDVGIPRVRRYKRGDIVVFRNPHYSMDRRSEVRTVTSQLVYMLTFMAVNLNRDENGEPKADPLVKRVAGEPGEQLVMQDGTLYRRTADNPQWQAVEADAQKAAWNLNALDDKTKRGVEALVLSQEQYDTMIACEAKRRALDVGEVKAECLDLARQFESITANKAMGAASSPDGRGGNGAVALGEPDAMSAAEMNEYVLFSRYDSLTQHLLTSPGGAAWFHAFMTDWLEHPLPAGADVYTEANWRLNLMIKRCLGSIVVETARIIMNEASSRERSDGALSALFREADTLHLYVQLLDQRNMCVFPPNTADGQAQYIPHDCYFMMGDNRFNSMDMRHSYTEHIAPLTPLDKYSVTYRTNLAPQYVNARRILGTTAFRFWPPGRIGKL